jgi:hypothetical protein
MSVGRGRTGENPSRPNRFEETLTTTTIIFHGISYIHHTLAEKERENDFVVVVVNVSSKRFGARGGGAAE